MRTQMRTKWVGLMGVMLIGAATAARADLFVIERFEYPSGNNTLQLDSFAGGGTGWGGNWTDTGAGLGATFQTNNFFVHSLPPAGGMPAAAGGSMNKAANNPSYNQRTTADMSTYFEDGDTVWFSYVLAVRGPMSNRFNLGFGTTANTGNGSGFGISLNATGSAGAVSTPATLHARINDTLSADSISLTLSTNGFGVSGHNPAFFVVGRLTMGVGAGTDVLDLWVNEGTTLPGTPTLSLTGVSLSSTPDRFSFFTPPTTVPTSGLPQTALWLDEIKMGTSEVDLGLTLVPEPSTIAMLLLGAGFLWRRRSARG